MHQSMPYYTEEKKTDVIALKAEGLIEGGEQQIQQYVPQQQPQYPIQIQNSTETVIMEVHPGMQITLPTPDGQNQTVHGPYQIKMQLAPNSAPPIQAPPNYQIVVRLDVEPETQQVCRFFSVVPIPTAYIQPGFPEVQAQGDYIQPYEDVKEEAKECHPGGETDEEKNNIKIVLGGIEAPELIQVGTTSVELKWRALAKAEQLKEPVSYICEVQCMSKKGAEIGQWDARYQGRDLRCRIEKLVPGAEYLSRLKARHQNITGNESEVVPFKTSTDAPGRPERPQKELHQQKEKLTLKWKAPCDNGDPIREYTLEMCAVNTQTYRGSPSNEIRKIVFTGRAEQYTLGEKKKDALRPGYLYKFRVRAANGLGAGPYSEELQYQTANAQLPKPEGLRVVERTTNMIKVEWNRVQTHERNQVRYRLQVAEADTDQFNEVFEGGAIFFKVNNLRRATNYKFRVQSLGEGAASTFSSVLEESTTAEQPSQPYKPSHKQLRKMEPHEALDEAHLKKPGPFYKCDLSWKAPKETGGMAICEYQLQQRIADRNSSSWEVKYRGSEESTTVDNLPPGSRIEFRVQAISPAGSSAWSMPELVTTRPGKPKAPKKITIDSVDTTQATISWSVGLCVTGGSVQRYQIKVEEVNNPQTDQEMADDPRVQFKNQDKQARQCTLRDLTPGCKYRVYIRTINTGQIESDWSQVELATKSDRPEAPTDISVTAVQSQMVAIEWSPPKPNGSPITGYEIEVCSGTSKSIQYTQSGETTFSYSKLNANTEYTFRVAATNQIGRSGFSQVCKIRTLASSPHIPNLTAKLEYSIPVVRQHALLRWDKPSDQGAEISGYKIECRSSQGDQEFNEPPSETELRVSDLSPSTNYRFRIQATNDRGSSPFTEWCSITTRELPPHPPQLVESEVSHNSVRLTWTSTGAKYLLQMFKTNNKHVSSWKEVYRGEKVTYRASKLLEGSVYKFRISASNNSGDGQFSAPIEIKTTRAAPPPIKSAPSVTIDQRVAIVNWASSIQGVTLSDLRYKVKLFARGNPIEEFETSQKEFRIPSLEEETDYQVQVCSVRRDLSSHTDKKADYSPMASFFIKKEVKATPPPEQTKLPILSPLPFNWQDDSVTALLLFLFAILAVLIALCGHNMN